MKDFTGVFEAKRRYDWVILLGNADKSPEICGPWGELKEKGTQTEAELQAIIDRAGKAAKNWGPITGVADLFSPDFDWGFIYALWYHNFGDRVQTLTYQTPNGGARPLFRTNEKPPGDPFKNTLNTEFKGNHYVVVGGEALDINGDLKPYELVIDKPILRDDNIIADTTAFFNELLKGRYRFLQYKCIHYHLIEKRPKEGKWIVLNHRQSLAINAFMVYNGCEDWEIHNFRRCCYDYDGQRYTSEYKEKTTNGQIKSTRKFIEGGGLPFPCKPTETNEGLAAIFSFDEAGCSGCPRKSMISPPSEPEEPGEKETSYDIGDTFLYKGDRKFQGRVQITALGRPYSRFMKLEMKCTGDKDWCSGCVLKKKQKLDFENQNMDASAFATYFDTNNPVDALRVLVERTLEPNCAAWKSKTSCSGKRERAITTAVVLDKSAIEGRAWFVHGPNCDLKRGPNWVVADGWLCKGSKGKIGILVRGFSTDSEIDPPSDEKIAKSREILTKHRHAGDLEGSTVWTIAKILQRKSQLKGKEVEKGFVSDLLTIGSSTWVKTIEGPQNLGATTSEIGPTTTAKSQRQREVTNWLGTGTYKAGRMTKAGLTAGAEKVEGIGWVVRKGLLPSCDLNYLVLDNMPSYILDSQIESRRNGIIELTAMRGMELWSRARLKLLSNPTNPFDETLYKCTALKTYDRKLIARFTFAVFTYGVTSEDRYKPDVEVLTEEDRELLDAARTVLRWNMSKEITYEVPLDLWPEIMKTSKELEDKYGCEDIPLLLRSIPHKLGVLMYSFALLEGAEKPDKSHLDLAKEWLEFCAADIELDNYVIQWRDMHTLSNIEYETIREKLEKEIGEDIILHGGGVIDSSFYRFIEYLAKNEKATRDEVAAYLECTGRTISDKAKFLKGLQLLKSDKDGYSFIGKGVRFVRRWLPSVTGEGLQPSYEEEKKLALIWLSDPRIIPFDEGWADLEEFQQFISYFFKGRLDKSAELVSLMIDEGLVELNEDEGDLIRLVKIEKEVG